MFDRSKLVISDLELAIKQFEKEPIDDEFRLTLVLCVSLLRSVGNVLVNECLVDANLTLLNKRLFAKRKEDVLFKEFIKGFRDTLLKEYKAPVGWASIEVYINKEKRVEYLLKTGTFEGEDIRTLLQQGTDWWKKYILELEQSAE